MMRSRCYRVREGIRDQRYTKHGDGQVAGPDIRAVFSEIEDTFREVAALSHPDSDNAVFEARIGDIAVAARSAIGDLLELVGHVLYLDPATWSLRKAMTRRDQIRKALKPYRTLSPCRYHVKGVMIAARLARGANPISLAASFWKRGKIRRNPSLDFLSYAIHCRLPLPQRPGAPAPRQRPAAQRCFSSSVPPFIPVPSNSALRPSR